MSGNLGLFFFITIILADTCTALVVRTFTWIKIIASIACWFGTHDWAQQVRNTTASILCFYDRCTESVSCFAILYSHNGAYGQDVYLRMSSVPLANRGELLFKKNLHMYCSHTCLLHYPSHWCQWCQLQRAAWQPLRGSSVPLAPPSDAGGRPLSQTRHTAFSCSLTREAPPAFVGCPSWDRLVG